MKSNTCRLFLLLQLSVNLVESFKLMNSISKYNNMYSKVYKNIFKKRSNMDTNFIELNNNSTKLDKELISLEKIDSENIQDELIINSIENIKDAGTAGIVSYAITEGGFWLISIPLSIYGASISTGSVPDLSTQNGISIVGGYSLGLLTFARFLVPLRIALALAITPWVKENIIYKLNNTLTK